jgi:hypothetical protein
MARRGPRPDPPTNRAARFAAGRELPMATIHEPSTEWRNTYQTSFRLSDQRLTLSIGFSVSPKQGSVLLELDQLPLLDMTSDEARAWALKIIRIADRADQVADDEAARYEATQLKLAKIKSNYLRSGGDTATY